MNLLMYYETIFKFKILIIIYQHKEYKVWDIN